MDAVTVVGHLIAVKRYTTASYAFALYEYIITIDREIETFWRRKFTFATALWFLNRYTLYFSLFPTLTGFLVPFTEEWPLPLSIVNRCIHFVKFPGAMQIISNVASGITLSLRVYALYGQAWWVIIVLLPAFLAELGLESWAVAGGVPAVLPPGQIGCILTGRQDQGDRFAAFWIGQLVFPTLIFLMTLTRALRLRRYGSLKGSVLTVMLRDGIMYFLVIFIANTANVLTYAFAPEDLKFANAPFTNVITTLMICRLMLNLRRAGTPTPSINDTSNLNFKPDVQSRRTYLGDLGEDVDIDNLNLTKREVVRAHTIYDQEWAQEESGFELNTLVAQRRR